MTRQEEINSLTKCYEKQSFSENYYVKPLEAQQDEADVSTVASSVYHDQKLKISMLKFETCSDSEISDESEDESDESTNSNSDKLEESELIEMNSQMIDINISDKNM